MSNQPSTDTKSNPYEQENKEAEKLARELEAPFGAERLGKEAYETAKKDMAQKGAKH
jgi:hypothetical protein